MPEIQPQSGPNVVPVVMDDQTIKIDFTPAQLINITAGSIGDGLIMLDLAFAQPFHDKPITGLGIPRDALRNHSRFAMSLTTAKALRDELVRLVAVLEQRAVPDA